MMDVKVKEHGELSVSDKSKKLVAAIGMRVVGRPQTNGTLACLYNTRDLWDTLVIVGKVDKGCCQIINELQKTNRVIWDTGEGLSGYQAMRLMYHLKSLELQSGERVLFIDDDLIFDRAHIAIWVKELMKNQMVVMASPTSQTTGQDLEVMFDMPSFDLLCTMMDANLINRCLGEHLWLLAELNGGGEFFFMQWMFEQVSGVQGNEIFGGDKRNLIKVVDTVREHGERRPLHLWIPDRFKVWNDLPLDWWEELYSIIRGASDVRDMRKKLNERKLLFTHVDKQGCPELPGEEQCQ